MDHHDHDHDHGKMHGGDSSMTTLDSQAMNHDNHVDHSQMNHHSMASTGHDMKMYFHASNEATILFYSWTTTTAAGMFGSCMAVMILALIYEGLKMFRDRLFHATEINRQKKSYKVTSLTAPSDDNHHVAIAEPSAKHASAGREMLNKDHLLQTLLHVIQLGISYLLMLIFMTYNVWLCISVIAGAGLGYFLFGWMRTRIINAYDHCH